jgi:hypothetical protein
MDAVERLDSLKLSDSTTLRITQVAKVLGISPQRVRVLAKPKNPLARSRIKSCFNERHRAYEIQVKDLRDFIVNDFSKRQPGRPRRKVS